MLAEHIASTTPAPVAAVESDDDLTALIESLPPQQRLALSLYYYADLSVSEVADAMKLSEGAVKYHLHAARTSLSHSLERRHDS
jgi:RNA polymerase sigma-70 factor (ECF subfamily)